MEQAEADLFDHQQVRQCSINQILGTDMKKHFDITSRFQVSRLCLPAGPYAQLILVKPIIFQSIQSQEVAAHAALALYIVSIICGSIAPL